MPALGQVGFLVLVVVLGVAAQAGALLLGDEAQHLARQAHHQAARRDLHALRDEAAGRDDALVADARVVEDRGAHPDQAVGADPAAVQRDRVADRHVVGEHRRVQVLEDVHDAVVLDVGVGADPDRVDVAAHDGVHPDAGVVAQLDVADHLGRGVDVHALAQLRPDALVRTNHGSRRLRAFGKRAVYQSGSEARQTHATSRCGQSN